MDQPLFVKRSMCGGCVFSVDRTLESDPTGKRIGEKMDAVFLDFNSLYPSPMSHYPLLHGNYKHLDNL